MSDDNPQDVQTPGTSAPKEPGEIGWPANFSAPGDASLQGVATAAPTIVEGVLVAADGSELQIVHVETVEAPPAEPDPVEVVEAVEEVAVEEVVDSEYAPDPVPEAHAKKKR